AQIPALYIIHSMIGARLQATQLNLTLPRRSFAGCKKCVIHMAVFLDGIRLAHIVAVAVEIQESALGKHLPVVDTNPLLPVRLFLRSQRDRLEFWPRIRPHKFGADYT